MTPVAPIPVANQSPVSAEPIVPTVRIRSRPVKSTGLPVGTDGPTTSAAPGNPEGLGSGSVGDNSPVGTDAGILPHPEAGPTGSGASSRLHSPIAPTEMTSSRESAETTPPDVGAEPERRLPLPIASQPISGISSSNVPAAEAPRTVGYGKPPLATRFAPGNNANPRGRPKGAKNHLTILRDALNEKVIVTQNGRKKTMTKYAIGATKLANRFTETPDPKIFLMISKVFGSSPAEGTAPATAAHHLPLTSPEKLNILEWFFQKRLLEENAKADEAQDQPPAPSDAGGQARD